MKKIIILALLLLAGCDKDSSEVVSNVSKRQKEFKSGGYVVGTLEDGRKVVRYEIDNGPNDNHWIYVVDSVSSTSINYQVPSGKTSKTETIVVINGVQFVPAEKEE